MHYDGQNNQNVSQSKAACLRASGHVNITSVQIFKEEEEAVKVELHEGCGRIKLYWTMALADYRTLKGMIEFKESGSGELMAHLMNNLT